MNRKGAKAQRLRKGTSNRPDCGTDSVLAHTLGRLPLRSLCVFAPLRLEGFAQ
jgi:hypothetical protein